MLWRLRTPKESFIATSSQPIFLWRRTVRQKSSISDWPSRRAEPGSSDAALEDSLTAVGVIPGTAVYMSPEQARGEELDARSDLFSLGVVLYEMATGKKPFATGNVITTLDAVLNQKPVSPLSLNPALPPDLEGIIGRAMEKDRGHRYPSALAMKGDLQSLRKETESGLTKTGARRPALPYRIATSTFQATSKVSHLSSAGSERGAADGFDRGRSVVVQMRQMAGAGAPKNTIAVLPLQNLNGDISVEFLRFALADEIANTLTYTRTLDVRPSAITQKFVGNDVDPQAAGRELHVANILTGHFLKQGDSLHDYARGDPGGREQASVADQRDRARSGSDRIAGADGCPDTSGVAAGARRGRRLSRYRHAPEKRRRPTISTCIAWRCRMIPGRTRMPSRSWSTWSRSTHLCAGMGTARSALLL